MSKNKYNFSSISGKDLERIHNDENTFYNVYRNGISFPRTSSVNSYNDKIGNLYDGLVDKRKKLLKPNKCYIMRERYNSNSSSYDYCIYYVKDKDYKVDVIYISENRCSYENDIDGLRCENAPFGNYYEFPVEFYGKIISMVNRCNKDIESIMEPNFVIANKIYDSSELDRYCHVYKYFYPKNEILYNDESVSGMTVSEFNDELSIYNNLVDDTMDRMVAELTDEFIKKHRYIICDNGLHCYSIKRFDKFYVNRNYGFRTSVEDSIRNNVIYHTGEYISYVGKSNFGAQFGHIDYSSMDSSLSLDVSFNEGNIYVLNDDSLGDKLFGDYKEIYKVVSEMYDNVNRKK